VGTAVCALIVLYCNDRAIILIISRFAWGPGIRNIYNIYVFSRIYLSADFGHFQTRENTITTYAVQSTTRGGWERWRDGIVYIRKKRKR